MMTKIQQYSDFTKLQKDYPRTRSNDYLLPHELRALIKGGNLSCIADDHGLFTFVEREGFHKLIFRLRDDSATLPETNLPLGAYLIYRAGNPPIETENWLLGQGFTLFRTLDRYTAKHVTGDPIASGVTTANAEETYTMLRTYFNPAEMDLPCRDMFKQALCIRSEDGTPLGVLYDMGHTRIVAVSAEARGLGIGARLYRAYAAGAGKPSAFHEWIRPDNTASIALFGKLGFTKDTLVTACYIRK